MRNGQNYLNGDIAATIMDKVLETNFRSPIFVSFYWNFTFETTENNENTAIQDRRSPGSQYNSETKSKTYIVGWLVHVIGTSQSWTIWQFK